MGRKSNKQQEILTFLSTFVEKYDYAPSVRQICEGVGLKSTATVHYHLRALKDAGMITMDAGHNRTIVLTSQEEESQGIPIVGTVAAGIPITAVEHLEGYLPWMGEDGDFALRVKGDSMINAAIAPGDYVIVRHQNTANHGEIVVALLDEEATVKRLSLDNDGVWLMPENENYDPIDGSFATILGVVKGLHRLYV